MQWKPFTSGRPYTCKDCPAYIELKDRADTWQQVANGFYHWFPTAAREALLADEETREEFREHWDFYLALRQQYD